MSPGTAGGPPARTRQLTETAFLVALAAILFFLAQIPVVGPLLCLGCPFPLTLLVHRHGLAAGLRGSLALAALLVLSQGFLAVFAVPFVAMGLTLGALLRSGRPALECCLLGAGGLGGAGFVALFAWENGLAGWFEMKPLLALAREATAGAVQGALAFLATSQGMTAEAFAATGPGGTLVRLGEVFPQLLQFLAWMPLGPALLGGALAFGAYFEASRFLLPRFGVAVPPVPPLRRWRAPRWVGGAALVLALLAAAPAEALRALEPASVPYVFLALVSMQILAVFGCAVLGAALLDGLLVDRVGLPWWVARPIELGLVLVPLPVGFGLQWMALGGALGTLAWGHRGQPAPSAGEPLGDGVESGGGEGAAPPDPGGPSSA